MQVSNADLVELDAYQLKDVAIDWYKMWVPSRGQKAPLMVWTEFVKAFMDHFIPLELREEKVDEFFSLKYDKLSIKEYFLWFT